MANSEAYTEVWAKTFIYSSGEGIYCSNSVDYNQAQMLSYDKYTLEPRLNLQPLEWG